MKIEQIYTNCMAHAAYYLESNGEAAIFDPLREVDDYIAKAVNNHATIKYVFETHFHADFVSGHLDLAKKTGAIIVYGPTAKPQFEALIAEDGQEFWVGNCRVKAIHTPGHTLESTTYLLIDELGKEHGIISGDTLFIGDVGRPDLAQHVVADLTEDKLAKMLYHSLRTKIMPLSDDLIVYPNHGAGSACGKNMSKETTDTLGNQKRTNYALRANMTEEEFVSELLNGLTQPPGYFPKNVLLNIKGYESLESVLTKGKKPIEVKDIKDLIQDGSVIVLDTRSAAVFADGFIPNSINIGIDGNFAMWVGEMIENINQKFVLVTELGREEECMIRLSRVGYDGTIGYLAGGFEAWINGGFPIQTIKRIEASEITSHYSNWPIVDVRKKSEFDAEHVQGAINIPLNQLYKRIHEFPTTNFVLHCAGGYRSMIAASLLYQRGIQYFVEVNGGFSAIKETSLLPITDYVCPLTML